jgi:hypothetical protein
MDLLASYIRSLHGVERKDKPVDGMPTTSVGVPGSPNVSYLHSGRDALFAVHSPEVSQAELKEVLSSLP